MKWTAQDREGGGGSGGGRSDRKCGGRQEEGEGPRTEVPTAGDLQGKRAEGWGVCDHANGVIYATDMFILTKQITPLLLRMKVRCLVQRPI